MKYSINEIADAVINWKGAAHIVAGPDSVEFTRNGEEQAIRALTVRYEGFDEWRLIVGGFYCPLPVEISVRIAAAREAARC